MTLADIIQLYSTFTIGESGDISEAQLSILETNATARLSRLIGSRSFSAGETEELIAFLILDILQNRHGKGVIVSESVKDSSWKAQIQTSSYWMDQVYAKISEYDSEHNEISSVDLEGARRSDAYIPELMQGYSDEYEGV